MQMCAGKSTNAKFCVFPQISARLCIVRNYKKNCTCLLITHPFRLNSFCDARKTFANRGYKKCTLHYCCQDKSWVSNLNLQRLQLSMVSDREHIRVLNSELVRCMIIEWFWADEISASGLHTHLNWRVAQVPSTLQFFLFFLGGVRFLRALWMSGHCTVPV